MAAPEELKKKIKALREANEDDLADKFQRDLDKMTGGKTAAPSAGGMVIPVSEEEFEKSGSKFAKAGMHLSEFGLPYWKQAGVSIAFPFTIIAKGEDNGKESEISAGVSKAAVWKLKEILSALEVATGKDRNGNVTFDPADVAGKTALTLWTAQKDTRSVEEGGKGITYTKPVSVLPVGSEPPAELGI